MQFRILTSAVFAICLAVISVSIPMGSPTASATTIAPLTDVQMTDAATHIVRGEVTEVWTELDSQDLLWTRARLSVSQVLKGPDVDELIIDSLGGISADQIATVEGAARFSEGENVLVFLDTISEGRLTPVSMFRGKYTIRRAPGERKSYVRRWHGRLNSNYDARFLPHPPAKKRVYLDDLVDQVQARLDTGWDGKPIPGISNTRLETVNTKAWRRR